MAASGSTNINVFPIPIPINDDEEEDQQPILSPKPPTPDQDQMHRENYVAEVLAEDDIDIVSTDPPPPYPSSNRGSRRIRTNLRSVRITGNQVIEDPVVDDGSGDTERTPLLPVNRRRAASHSSTTTPSVNSIGHTVLSSSRNVISLFQSDPDSTLTITTTTTGPSSDVSFSTRIGRYFKPLVKRAYYSAVFHLLFINFPYELVAWIYLFAGTLTGTTLLITLPLGIILCFLDLIGARAFARGEIYLQTLFHGPLSINAPNPPNPLFSRMRPPESISDSEMGEGEQQPVPETSFLKLAYLMFKDPTSYQALFYFLVIKPGITLLIALGILILLPPAFILILPAPAVLRAIRRVGIWQAEIALDALK